jgi:hypothetical protein
LCICVASLESSIFSSLVALVKPEVGEEMDDLTVWRGWVALEREGEVSTG